MRPTPHVARMRLRQVLELWADRYGLTRAEAEVTRHAVRGLTNKEIAFLLGISAATVRTELANVFKKLDVSSRTELSYRAFCERPT
jgi:DNA-binding NarL/FixJ family response regulator